MAFVLAQAFVAEGGGGCSDDCRNALRLPRLPLDQSEDPPISSFPSGSGPVVSLINVRLQSWQGTLASDARSLQSPNWLGWSQAVWCFFSAESTADELNLWLWRCWWLLWGKTAAERRFYLGLRLLEKCILGTPSYQKQKEKSSGRKNQDRAIISLFISQ